MGAAEFLRTLRFGQIIAIVLSVVIAVIVVISLLQLIQQVFMLLWLNAFESLDPEVTGADKIAALAGAVLALGIVYWTMRERDEHDQLLEERKP